MVIIKAIYSKHKTPLNLQEHMLRVGALASILLDNWTGPAVDKTAVVQACLLHDLAKPINFDLSQQARFGMTDQEVAEVKELRQFLVAKYGNDEHRVAIGMCRAMACSLAVIKILDNFEWRYSRRLLAENDFGSLIALYGDMRIGPDGILSLKARIKDLKIRVSKTNLEVSLEDCILVENKIKANVKIDVNSITDKQLNERFEKLLAVEV